MPQHEFKDKKMKFFTSGTVAMDVNLEKSGFFQGRSLQMSYWHLFVFYQALLTFAQILGEGLKVLACIENKSSREIKPKYCVYRKHSFFAEGRRKVDTKDLIKEVGEPIPPSTNENVTKIINIPHDMEPSIHNCSIIKAEHRLRVSYWQSDWQNKKWKYKLEKEWKLLSLFNPK